MKKIYKVTSGNEIIAQDLEKETPSFVWVSGRKYPRISPYGYTYHNTLVEAEGQVYKQMKTAIIDARQKLSELQLKLNSFMETAQLRQVNVLETLVGVMRSLEQDDTSNYQLKYEQLRHIILSELNAKQP